MTSDASSPDDPSSPDMTRGDLTSGDLPPDPDALDELVTAVLDGEASPEEAAALDAHPGGAVRLAELAAVRSLVAAPVPTPPGLDEVLGAALAAGDDVLPPATAAPDPPPSPGVTDLGAARARRQRTHRLLAVAAAVVVLALAVPLLDRLDSASSKFSAVGTAIDAGGADREDAAESAADEDAAAAPADGDASSATAESGSAATGSGAADQAPGTTVAPSTTAFVEPSYADSSTAGRLGDLGAHPSTAALLDAVRAVATVDAVARWSEPGQLTLAPEATCDRLRADLPAPGAAVAAGTATVAGQPVVVVVQRPAAGGDEVLVITTDCTTLLDRGPLAR